MLVPCLSKTESAKANAPFNGLTSTLGITLGTVFLVETVPLVKSTQTTAANAPHQDNSSTA